jgi:hypothetical protein
MIPLGVVASAHVVSAASPLALRGSWTAGGTHTAVPLGSAHPDRKVLVGLSAQTTTDALWTVTVGGVTATLVDYYNTRARLWLYEVSYPTGSTADIVVSGVSTGNLLEAVWTVLGSMVDVVHGNSTAPAPAVTLPNTLSGDSIVGISMGFSATAQPTWSGGVTEVAVGVTATTTNKSSAAMGFSGGSAPIIKATWPDGTPTIMAASYRWDGT